MLYEKMELPLSIRRVILDAGTGATVIVDCTTGDAIVELEKAIEMYNEKFVLEPVPEPVIGDLDFSDQLVGTVVVKKSNNSRHLITDQFPNGLNFNEDWTDYDELRKLYTHLDGSPLEKEK